MDLIREPSHVYRPATAVFLDLDVARIAADFDLAERGARRGEGSRPAADAQDYDDIEYQIIERIESHKQDAHSIYIAQWHTYDDRLAALNFDERISVLQKLSLEAVGDFRAEAAQGRDELFVLRRQVCECEAEREHFRASHALIRPARLSTPGKTTLTTGILAILFVVEVVINGGFLAKSNAQGMFGGILEAVSFAGLNIIASFLCGLVPVRLINRRFGFLKLLGLITLPLYLAFAASLNLTLAHLREMPPTLADDVGHQVLESMMNAPFLMHDVNSWVFFGIGFIFSIGAMSDGLLFSDPVLGYASVERRCLDAHRHFSDDKDDLIGKLREIRDEASEAMSEAARSLTLRRGEYDSIVQGRSGLSRRFVEHQNQIERTCRALLTIYREANRTKRAAPEPGYWSKPYNLERVGIVNSDADGSAQERLRKLIAETQVSLNHQIRAVQDAFDQAVASYREIEDLIPENTNGAWKKAA